MVDVLIIGAGVTGSAIARELARTERSILVLERGLDVSRRQTGQHEGKNEYHGVENDAGAVEGAGFSV